LRGLSFPIVFPQAPFDCLALLTFADERDRVWTSFFDARQAMFNCGDLTGYQWRILYARINRKAKQNVRGSPLDREQRVRQDIWIRGNRSFGTDGFWQLG
jgi:hypothetical protein